MCVGPSHSGLMYLVITAHYHCGRACHGALCSADPSRTQQMCLKAVKWPGGRGAVIKTKKKSHVVLLSCYLSAPNPRRLDMPESLVLTVTLRPDQKANVHCSSQLHHLFYCLLHSHFQQCVGSDSFFFSWKKAVPFDRVRASVLWLPCSIFQPPP